MKAIKVISICIITALITTSVMTLIAPISRSVVITEKMNPMSDDQQIYLGQANLYGDGIENNTIIDLKAEKKIFFGIESKVTTVDFYITYSIECDGLTDSGFILLLIQINKENRGYVEHITLDSDEGTIIVENVGVKRGDVLTFEIGATYANLVPTFTIVNYTFGGGVVYIKTQVTVDKIFALFEQFIESSIIIQPQPYKLESALKTRE